MLILASTSAWASGGAGHIDLTDTVAGFSALIIFSIAYLLVIGEEFIHLRKSKPVLVAAGVIWFCDRLDLYTTWYPSRSGRGF